MHMSIGERLREERERLGLSQLAFGEMGGVKKLAQLKYEKGERAPDAIYLSAVSKIGVDVQYVITGERSAAAMTNDERELIESYRGASLAVKAATIGALNGGVNATHGATVLNISGNASRIAGRDFIDKK